MRGFYASSLYINKEHNPIKKRIANFVLGFFGYKIESVFNAEGNCFIEYQKRKK